MKILINIFSTVLAVFLLTLPFPAKAASHASETGHIETATAPEQYYIPQVNFVYHVGSSMEYSGPGIGYDGTIYVGARDHYISAINPDGTLKWRSNLGGRAQYKSPSIDSDGTIYLGVEGPYLSALNPDGTRKWQYRAGSDYHHSPAIGHDGTLYTANGEGFVHAISPDGQGLWTQYIGLSPHFVALDTEGNLYVGTHSHDNISNYLYALDPNGSIKWTFFTQGGCSQPVIGADGTIYVGCRNGFLYAVNPDGTEKWRYHSGGSITGHLAIGSDGTVYVGSNNGMFHAVDANRNVKWTNSFGRQFDTHGAPLVDADGTVYFGTSDGYLYAFDKDGNLLWYYLIGENISSPLAVDMNGNLLCTTHSGNLYSLYCGKLIILADSPWPKYAANMRNTACASDSISPSVRFPVISLDSLTTAFDSSFVIDITYKAWQPLAGLEFSIYYDTANIRADSVLLADKESSLTLFLVDIIKSNSSGQMDLAILDFTLSNPLPTGEVIIAEAHFTEIGHEEKVLDLELGNLSGSTAEGEHVELKGINGQLKIVQFFKNCDINRDGRYDILDIVAFLLGMRDDRDNDEWDWNEDGIISVADVVTLLLDMRNGNCPELESGILAAAISSRVPEIKLPSLSESDVSYLAEIAARLPLTDEELQQFEAVLDRKIIRPALPKVFSLSQNHPNPFNPSTAISFTIPEGDAAQVGLTVYDIRGRIVRRLLDGDHMPGKYTVYWDSTDEKGAKVPSGVYLYRLQANSFSQTRKMVLLK